MNTKRKEQFVSYSTYQGKSNTYNLIKIETNRLSTNSQKNLRSDFVNFFNNNLDEKLGGNENTILDLSNVDNLDSSGIGAILTLNRLNRNKYGKSISLVNCQENVYHLLDVLNLKQILENPPSKKNNF